MGVDLAVKLAGIHLEYPILLAAGPLAHDAKAIARIQSRTRVGAIVTKTIYARDCDTAVPYLVREGNGLINFDWSGRGVRQWVKELPRVVDTGVPVIASIFDPDPQVLADMAAELESVGVAAVQYAICEADPLDLARTVRLVCQTVSIPVIPKFWPTLPNLKSMVLAAYHAGAAALCAINTLGPGLSIETETGRPRLANRYGEGFLSGSPVKPLALHCVASMALTCPLPIIGSGGVQDWEDAVHMFMVGAQAVALHTAALLRGPEVIGEIIDGLCRFLERHGYSSINDIRGKSLQYLKEEPESSIVRLSVNAEKCNPCGVCIRSCAYRALSLEEGKVSLDSEACRLCGLCTTLCPQGALTLEYIRSGPRQRVTGPGWDPEVYAGPPQRRTNQKRTCGSQ